MKRNIFMLSFMLIIGVLVFTGCNRKKVTDPAPDPLPTVTTQTVTTPYILAAVTSYGPIVGLSPNLFSGSVIITDVSTSAIVKDSTVTVNGIVFPYYALKRAYEAPDNYNLGTTLGTKVTLNISSSLGNFNASGVMPAIGGSVSVSIPGCYTGSELILTSAK